MITAMTYLVILLVIAIALIVAAVRNAFTDGRGVQPPPVSHYEDTRFRSPAASV